MASEADIAKRNKNIAIDIPLSDKIDSDGNEDDGNESGNKAATKGSQHKKNAQWADVLTFCKEIDESPYKFQCLICV